MPRKEKWVYDGHVDLGEAALYFGCDPFVVGNGIKPGQHEFTPNAADLPRLKEGGVKLFAANTFAFRLKQGATEHEFRSPDRWSTEIRRYKALHEAMAERPNSGLMLVRNTQELDKCLNTSDMGMFFTVEGVNGLRKKTWERDLELAKEVGVVSIGGWNLRSMLWEPHSVVDGKGLTDVGRDFVKYAGELGIAIDLSHMGNRAADQVLEILPDDKRVVFTHANCHALKDHSRNARDQQLIAVHKRGGINGNTFSTSFHKQNGVGNLETLLDHYDHHVALGIAESSAVASDYYGLYITSGTPELLDARSAYRNLEAGLLRRGHTQRYVDGVMFDHGERVLRATFVGWENRQAA